MGVGLGGRTWPAAHQFCSLIAHHGGASSGNAGHSNFLGNLFDGRTVIDLGSGTGVSGILVNKLYKPKKVVITDLESHIKHIQHNIDINRPFTNDCAAIEYDWFNCQSFNCTERKFDIVLAFECVYKETLYLPLIQSMLHVSDKDTVIFLGLTRLFAKKRFFSFLRDNGLEYTMLPSSCMPLEYQQKYNLNDVGLFIVRLVK